MAVLIMTIAARPDSALATVGTVSTTGQGLRVNVGLLNNLLPSIVVGSPVQQTWQTGGSTASASVGAVSVPILNMNTGVISALAGPVTGGGQATSDVAGLTLLNTSQLDVGAIHTACQMDASTISNTVSIANLKILGANVTVAPNLSVTIPGVAGVTVDEQTAAWNSSTGRLDYTVRALDLSLLSGGLLSGVANGSVVVGESTCSGIVRLGTVTPTSVNLIPGNTDTPSVTVTNTGDIAAPNTVITIPKPPTGYTLVGTPTVTGGGACTVGSTNITCTGVTVPGGGSAKVSLPVTLAASATSASNWAPTSGQITAVSTPVAAATGTTLSVSGSGTLVAVQPAASTGGTITVAPISLQAGKTASTTVTVTNQGPSNASATIRIPVANAPTGVTATVTAGSSTCPISGGVATCTGVSVPAGGSATVTVTATAVNATTPGTTWDLSGITTSLNGTSVTGQGRLLTITAPDVSLAGGVQVTPTTATPGGSSASVSVRVANAGVTSASNTTITMTGLPAGYTTGAISTSGGGTCSVSGTTVTCTGVTVPASGAVTVTVPVTLASNVTANWTGDVTATSGALSGSSTGATFVTAVPQATVGVSATMPTNGSSLPGDSTTMRVRVYDVGPSDAPGATFAIVAPANTTFGTLTGTAATICPTATATTLQCTTPLTAGAPYTGITVPLTISAQANPSNPVTGGCVSTDGNATCDPGDYSLPAFTLKTPLANRLTTVTTAGTITPGSTGTGQIQLTSTQNETGMTVSVPLSGLPTGFTVTGASTSTGGTCTVGSSAVNCTGVNLTANTPGTITLNVAVAGTATPQSTWTATPIAITSGSESATASGALAGTGNVSYTLAATVGVPANGTVQPGQSTTIQIATSNSGPSTATNATFTVTAPQGTTFGSLTGTGCTLTNSTTATCTATVPVGAGPVITLPLNVSSNDDPATPLTGGCVDLDGITGCGTNDATIPAITLGYPFSSQVNVTATKATPAPGATDTAVLNVAAQHGNLSNLTVTIPTSSLPTGVTVTGVPSSCTAGPPIVCTIPSITSGSSANLSLTVSATPGASPGAQWTETGITVAGTGGSVTTGQTLAQVGPAAHVLTAAVTIPSVPLLPGSQGTLGVTVSNPGPSNATGTTFGVTAPTGTTLGTLPQSCTLINPTHASCTVDVAAGNSVSLNVPITVDTTAVPGHQLANGCIDLNNDGTCGAGDTTIASITVGTPLDRRLSVTSAAATPAPGQTGTANLTFTSTAAETGIAISIPLSSLPSGVTVGTPTLSSGSCTVGATAITCTGVALAAGTGLTIAIPITTTSATAPGATWTATGIGVTEGTESATENATLVQVAARQTSITALATAPANASVSAGGTGYATVAVTNGGPSDAPSATFAVTAPTGTTFGNISGIPNDSICTAATSTVLNCTVSLTSGQTAPALSLPIVVPASADPFTAISGGCVDLDGVSGCSSNDVNIPSFQLDVPLNNLVAVTANQATVVPGAAAQTATINVTASHQDVNGLTVSIPVTTSNGLTVTPVSGPGGATCNTTGGAYVCSGVSILNGQTAALTFNVSATSATAQGVTWSPGITVTDAVPHTLTVARQAAITSAPQNGLTTTTTGPGTNPLPGASTTITATVADTGPSDDVGATWGYIAPTGATFTSAPAGCTLASPTRIRCSGSLLAGASPLSLTLPLTIDPSADPSRPVSGGCFDANDDGYCTGAADTALATINLATPFDRIVTVTTLPATVAQGQSGNAQFVISATQSETGLGVSMPLNLPAGVTTTGNPTLTGGGGGTCVYGTDAGSNPIVSCTGVDIAANSSATVTVPVAVDPAASASTVWSVPAVTVTGANAATATGGGVLIRASTPTYTLAANPSVPAGDTVLPGGTATVSVPISNTGQAVTAAPVVVYAPTGTTFGAISDPTTAADCPTATSTTLTCAITIGGTGATPVTLSLPVVVPSTAAAAASISGGCLDLDGGGCGGSGDQTIPAFTLRTPLASVLSAGSNLPHIVPGNTGTATLTLNSTLARNLQSVSVSTNNLPTGMTVTSATLGASTDCPISGGAAVCPAVPLGAGGSNTIALALATAPTATPGGTWTPALTTTDGIETAVLHPQTAIVDAASATATYTVNMPASGTLLPGGTGDIDISVSNAGPSVNAGLQALFRAPSGTTFGTLQAPASTYCVVTSPTLVTCTRDVPVGTSGFVLPIVVPAATAPGSTITGGCVDVDASGTCTSGGTDVLFGNIVLGKPFSAQVQLSLTPATVTPGGSATAQVVATADRTLTALVGTVPLSGLPTGLTVTGASGPTGSTCTLGTPQIVCSGVNLTATTATMINLTVRAATGMTAGTVWTPGPITVTNGNDTSSTGGTLITVGPAVTAVSYSVAAPTGTISAGGSGTLDVAVTNTGPSNATAKTVTLFAPSGTTFGALTPPTSTMCSLAGTTQINCVFSEAAGAAALHWSIPVQVPATASPGGTITGGCVDGGGDGACGGTGDVAFPSIALTPTLAQAVSVQAAGSTIVPGRTGTTTVSVATTKAGTYTITVPTTALPAGVTVTSAQAAGSSCTIGATAVTCTGVTVGANSTVAVTLSTAVAATASPSASWNPAVTVTDATGTTTAPAVLALTVGAADTHLSTTVTVPAAYTRYAGDTANLNITVSNSGSSQAAAVQYAVLAPSGTTFRALAGTTAAGLCALTSTTRALCTLTVPGNGRVQFPLGIAISSSATPATPLSGGCVDADLDGSCTSAADTVITAIQLATPLSGNATVGATNVSIAPGASGSAVVRVVSGTTLNNGTVTVPLTGLPAGMTVTGVTGPTGAACTQIATQLQCTGVNLIAGTTSAMTVTLHAASTMTANTAWTATPVTLTVGTESVTGTASMATVGTPTATIAWVADNNSGSLAPGDTVPLKITGTSSGPSDVTGRTATITAPGHTTFGALTGTAATSCTVTDTTHLSCTYGVAAGGSVVWTFSATVASTAVNGDTVTGGCVTADTSHACGTDRTVVVASATTSVSTNTTLTVGTTTVAPGSSGTATVTVAATATFSGLTLTVPLSALPTGITADSATLTGATCAIGSATITCTGLGLTAGDTTQLKIGVTVASTVTSGTTWPVSGVLLYKPSDTTDRSTAAGVLVATKSSAYQVSVSVGALSVAAPTPTQTTVLPITMTNTGTTDADPYPLTVVLPPGTTHGTLPTGCAEGSTVNIVTCNVTLKAGTSATVSIPLVVDADATPDSTITGGCLDGALTGGAPAPDSTCGGTTDVAIPDFTVTRFPVNLTITYPGTTLAAASGGTLLVKLPYDNNGVKVADGVRFTITPPAGVTVTKAQVLVDATGTTTGASVAGEVTADAADAAATTTKKLVTVTCKLVTGKTICDGPDAASGIGSQLQLTLAVAGGVKTGTYKMPVTVSTTSNDGYEKDNTVSVPLALIAAATTGTTTTHKSTSSSSSSSSSSSPLAKTGPDVLGLVLLSVLLSAGGVAAIILTGPATAGRPGRHRRRRHAARV